MSLHAQATSLSPSSLHFLDGPEVEVGDGEEDEGEPHQTDLVVPQPHGVHLKPSSTQIQCPVQAHGRGAANRGGGWGQ